MNVEIFEGEGKKFLEHVAAKGWEQPHIPPWALRQQAFRNPGAQSKKCPPAGFYGGGQKDPGWFLVFLLLAPNYCGSRWMSHYRYAPTRYDPAWQTTCTIPHRDQLNSRTKSEMSEQDRTFTLLVIDCSIRPEFLIRWILAVFHDLDVSCMRIVIQWPEARRPGRAPGPVTAIGVVQTDLPQTEALHFHRNE